MDRSRGSRETNDFREEADEPYGFVTYGDFFSEI